jgi:hypothetical protein
VFVSDWFCVRSSIVVVVRGLLVSSMTCTNIRLAVKDSGIHTLLTFKLHIIFLLFILFFLTFSVNELVLTCQTYGLAASEAIQLALNETHQCLVWGDSLLQLLLPPCQPSWPVTKFRKKIQSLKWIMTNNDYTSILLRKQEGTLLGR